MKKEWVKPELSNLGMENTNEDAITMDAEGRIFYGCQYCCERFWTANAKTEHEKVCFNRPATPGEGPDPVPIPGLS